MLPEGRKAIAFRAPASGIIDVPSCRGRGAVYLSQVPAAMAAADGARNK
jgi:hypothetical protein